MTGPAVRVLDSSVGVKWFRAEAGSDVAREMYLHAAEGIVQLVAPTHFVHEVLSVVRREMGPRAVPEGWAHLEASGMTIVPLSTEMIAEAARQCESLGCSFYDAFSPALATMLDAELWSADRAAHAKYTGVRLVGESVE